MFKVRALGLAFTTLSSLGDLQFEGNSGSFAVLMSWLYIHPETLNIKTKYWRLRQVYSPLNVIQHD